MSFHPKGNKEDEGSRPQATADITKTSSCCQAHRTPQGQRKLGQNPTAEEPRVANVSEPIWKPGLQTGRSGAIQAGTVLSGKHWRQTGSDRWSETEGNKQDKGSRPPATADIIKTRSCCQVYRTPPGLRMPGQNHTAEKPRASNGPEPLQETAWETGRSGAKLAWNHTHHTAGIIGDG